MCQLLYPTNSKYVVSLELPFLPSAQCIFVLAAINADNPEGKERGWTRGVLLDCLLMLGRKTV